MIEPSERDREIFAIELESCGEQRLAERIRNGTDNSNGGTAALAAIAKARREAIEECKRIAQRYADNPPSGPNNNTQASFDQGLDHEAGAADCAMCIRDAISALAEQPAPAAPPEPSETEWLRRLLRWCRPRLRHPSYQSWLDKYLAAGPSEAPEDEPPIVRSDALPEPEPSAAEVEDAVDAGIEAAAEAVSALPPGQKGWDQKEFMIAETAARSAIAEFARLAQSPTEAMLIAARDWSAKKYGTPIGSDAATGCWQAMSAALFREAGVSGGGE